MLYRRFFVVVCFFFFSGFLFWKLNKTGILALTIFKGTFFPVFVVVVVVVLLVLFMGRETVLGRQPYFGYNTVSETWTDQPLNEVIIQLPGWRITLRVGLYEHASK